MKNILFALVVFALSACGVPSPLVAGSGKMVTQTIDVRNFDQIRLGTSGVMYIEQGDDFGLTIEADDNILPILKVGVEKGVLTIRTEPATTVLSFETLIFHVTLPELGAIDLSGSAEVRVKDFTSESLHLNLSGSGDVIFINLDAKSLASRISGSGGVAVENLSAEAVRTEVNNSGKIRLAGTADTHEIRVSGSGDVLTENLQVSRVQLTVSGSGDVTLWALDSMDVIVSGSGNVHYFGLPELAQTISGAGDLISLGAK